MVFTSVKVNHGSVQMGLSVSLDSWPSARWSTSKIQWSIRSWMLHRGLITRTIHTFWRLVSKFYFDMEVLSFLSFVQSDQLVRLYVDEYLQKTVSQLLWWCILRIGKYSLRCSYDAIWINCCDRHLLLSITLKHQCIWTDSNAVVLVLRPPDKTYLKRWCEATVQNEESGFCYFAFFDG